MPGAAQESYVDDGLSDAAAQYGPKEWPPQASRPGTPLSVPSFAG